MSYLHATELGLALAAAAFGYFYFKGRNKKIDLSSMNK